MWSITVVASVVGGRVVASVVSGGIGDGDGSGNGCDGFLSFSGSYAIFEPTTTLQSRQAQPQQIQQQTEFYQMDFPTRTSHLQAFYTVVPTAVPQSAAEPYEDTFGISMKGVRISGRPLYLGMQATSPVDPRVLDVMLPYYLYRFCNPHSRTHLCVWESDQAVETARAQVAALINASPKEIVFTSGATDSNNISVNGVMHFYKDMKLLVVTT
ncbi:hypothetical protein F0562_006134 [Nyssa sinensis]|uniref:Aminotransferase class V domain-containing protein n=1 Tax=Nyssa sinensis TaxID=561372 RepID=A0A5J5AKD3_9ASTE|nr:hypothetical protein F0562_006134 [Nyssa sinensis]